MSRANEGPLFGLAFRGASDDALRTDASSAREGRHNVAHRARMVFMRANGGYTTARSAPTARGAFSASFLILAAPLPPLMCNKMRKLAVPRVLRRISPLGFPT
jgi:hypothetical protein